MSPPITLGALTAIVIMLLSGCVTGHRDSLTPVKQAVAQRLSSSGLSTASAIDLSADEVTQALGQPLSSAAAVRIALATNQRLRATFDELDISSSELLVASAIAPLEVHVEARLNGGGKLDGVGLDVTQNLLDLVQRGQRRRVATAELQAAQARTIERAVMLIATVERAYLDVVASQQMSETLQATLATASASADIAERQHAAGNISDLTLLREQAQREQARLDVIRAEVDRTERRERLNEAMGLAPAAMTWTIRDSLPPLPATRPALADFDQTTIAASLETAALASDRAAALGRGAIARTRAWLPELGIGIAAEREDGEWNVGPALRLGLPLFDRQQGQRARAIAQANHAQHASLAITAELAACARAVRAQVLGAYDQTVLIRDGILPQRRAILAETLLQYNAMNVSTFELLLARREVGGAELQLTDALHRFWQASVEARALARGAICRASDTPETMPLASPEGRRHD